MILEIEAPSLASVASMIRWPTISRSTRRATGTTMPGRIGAMVPPRATAERMYQGRKEGTFGAKALRLRAATNRSSGRITPSTKPTVKSRPLGSLSTPASCAAEASTGTFEPSVSQWRTSLMVSSARSWGRTRGVPSAARAGGTTRTCEVDWDTAASPWRKGVAEKELPLPILHTNGVALIGGFTSQYGPKCHFGKSEQSRMIHFGFPNVSLGCREGPLSCGAATSPGSRHA